MSKQLLIYIVSDSIGETADHMVHAVLAQFPNIDAPEIKRFAYVDDEEKLCNVLNLAKEKDAIVITTLVSRELNTIGEEYSKKHHISYIDYMTSLISIIEKKMNVSAVHESGVGRRLDSDYFKRIEAIEFAVKYDDGKNFEHLEHADALIVGVSRTSKTPLSMYLANKGYKVANIPIVPEVPIPESVFKNLKLKVFGLTASPDYIMNIRSERVRTLGFQSQIDYDSLRRIKEELIYAEEIFHKLNAIVINTEYKSIEESAFYIEKFLKNT